MTDLQVDTPNYVLLDRAKRLGPELIALGSGQKCIAVYGFSDKQPYDAFCKKSELALTPYPLVKGYLRNQLETADDAILIIAIDPAGPDESVLNAAIMQSVLEAQETKSLQVTVSHRLTRDEQKSAYRVEEIASDVARPLSR